MAVPPEHLLFPGIGINSFGHDFRSDLHPYGGGASASFHTPLPLSLSPAFLDSILQSERLRMELAEHSRQKAALFLKILEANVAPSMRQKQGNSESATNRTRELEALLIKTELVSKMWQKLAKEKEATIAELSSMLERVRETLVVGADAESSCESAQETTRTKMVCRVCHRQRSCVLFLPCRHLCCCAPCEPSLASCPVCHKRKERSMKVFVGIIN